MQHRPYHVYAIDGYESCHRSQRAAIAAARRGARTRRVPYQVVRSEGGWTGPHHGVVVAHVTAEGRTIDGPQ